MRHGRRGWKEGVKEGGRREGGGGRGVRERWREGVEGGREGRGGRREYSEGGEGVSHGRRGVREGQ